MIRKGEHIAKVGQMRHRMTIQSQVATPDGMGGSTITWADVATVWADIRPVSGAERAQADRLMLDVSHSILMRHRALSATTERLTMDGRVFNVVSLYDADESRSHLKVLAREDAVPVTETTYLLGYDGQNLTNYQQTSYLTP